MSAPTGVADIGRSPSFLGADGATGDGDVRDTKPRVDVSFRVIQMETTGPPSLQG